VLPALDYCLKCSHMFNLMDASGGIGVTERMAYIPQGAPDGRGDRERVGRRSEKPIKGGEGVDGSGTPARNRRRRAAGRVAAGADEAAPEKLRRG
jgi:hypothetical protein